MTASTTIVNDSTTSDVATAEDISAAVLALEENAKAAMRQDLLIELQSGEFVIQDGDEDTFEGGIKAVIEFLTENW